MFSVTAPAYRRLAQILELESPESVMRIIRVKRRLRIRVGTIRESDQIFTHEGRAVFALDEQMAKNLVLKKLDVKLTDEGPRLQLKKCESTL